MKVCPQDGGPLEAAFSGDLTVDGKYRVEQRLGRGGMGVVYRVRHVGLQRQFALKVVNLPHRNREYFLEHFQMEARALGRLKHPNIVDVTDYGVDQRAGGLPYLVMEYLKGRSLTELCRSEGALSLARALPIFEAIALAIDYAHDQGVLHRDLKPANILIVQDGNVNETTKILDFGLARLVAGVEGHPQMEFNRPSGELVSSAGPFQGEVNPNDTIVVLEEGVSLTIPPRGDAMKGDPRQFIEGTLAYLAPEALRGAPAAPSTDIYAFGVLIYETLVGKLPFSGSSIELLWGHLKSPPPLPSRVHSALPGELNPAILAALAKEPGKRPTRAKDVVDALRNAWLIALRREWRSREMPRRLSMASLLGIACALLSWPLAQLGLVENIEQRTIDARFRTRPLRPVNSRLLIVALDEPSIAADPTPLAERADQFGAVLERTFGAGARGVAVDFILPEQWARSEIFSRFLLTHAEDVTLAVIPSQTGEMIGTQCVNRLTGAALGPVRFAGLFGFANLTEDSDGVTRHARLSFRDTDGKKWDFWAGRAARSLSNTPSEKPFWIDYSADLRRLPKIPWKDVAGQLDRDASVFQGRLLLVGGDLIGSGDDYHRIPARGDQSEAVSGLALQSLVVNTILSGFPVQQAGIAPVLLIQAAICTAIIGAALCLSRLFNSFVIAIVLCAVYSGAAVACFRFRELLLPLAAPLLIAVLALGVGLMLRFYLTPFPVVRAEEA
jgi:serine/threonine protein kinase